MKKKVIAICVLTITSITFAFGFVSGLNCYRCSGKGTISVKETCPACNGNKKDKWGDNCYRCDGYGYIYDEKTCPECNGTGEQTKPVPFPER